MPPYKCNRCAFSYTHLDVYKRQFQDTLAAEKVNKKNLLALFPEVTKTDLAEEEETVRVHTTFEMCIRDSG